MWSIIRKRCGLFLRFLEGQFLDLDSFPDCPFNPQVNAGFAMQTVQPAKSVTAKLVPGPVAA